MPTIQPESKASTGESAERTAARKTRREFLQRGACLAGAGVVTLIIGDFALCEGAEGTGIGAQSAQDYDFTRHEYIYLIDTRKCIGCGACVRACSRENDVPSGFFRTWVERYRVSRDGEPEVDSPNGAMDGFEPAVSSKEITKAFFVPKICNHCRQTPCVQTCPVGASFRSPDGVVLVDGKRCIGCGYCVQACPYGTRFMHPVTHTASKCTLCYHRLTRGLTTACVEACPVGARRLGDAKQIGDEVSRIIASERIAVLLPELLTEPQCFYLGKSKEVR